jgi:hypothetical protein
MSKDDIPEPIRDVKHFHINDFPTYLRHLGARAGGAKE